MGITTPTLLTLLTCLLLSLIPATASTPTGSPDPLLLRYLGISGNGAGRWSADSSQIAFSTNWTGRVQKWLMPADGGFPRRITYFEDAVSFCDFSPHDPNLMWLGVDSGGNERNQLYFTSPDGVLLEPLAVNPDVIHRSGDWSRDGRFVGYVSNARDERYFDVYVLDRDTGEAEMVFSRDASLSAGRFSPDGKWVLAGLSHSNVDNDVFLVERDGGRFMLLTFHEEEAQFYDWNWADNRTLYFSTNIGREFFGLARLDLPENLEELQGYDFAEAMPPFDYIHEPGFDVGGVEVSPDGRVIGWVTNEDGFGVAHLAALPGLEPLRDAQGRALPPPDVPSGVQAIGRFSPDSRFVILQANGGQGPADLWRYDLTDGATLRLTYASLGGIPQESFVTPEVVRYESFDGLEISALWYEPPGPRPAGGWPVVIDAHGGPESQSRPWFDPQTQLYLSLGVAVLKPNVRGSSGYGKTFLTLDNVALRENSVADYAAARDWLVAAGLGDSRRIAITGASYGGYVVLAALTLYPEKWAAGVCGVGIANFVTFLEQTGPYRRAIREAEYGSLEHDYDLLVRLSPIHRVEQITAPLLLIHGANDPRVPVGEAQQMHDALEALGREVDLLVFEDEGHGLAKLENRAAAWQRELEFLRTHLGL